MLLNKAKSYNYFKISFPDILCAFDLLEFTLKICQKQLL